MSSQEIEHQTASEKVPQTVQYEQVVDDDDDAQTEKAKEQSSQQQKSQILSSSPVKNHSSQIQEPVQEDSRQTPQSPKKNSVNTKGPESEFEHSEKSPQKQPQNEKIHSGALHIEEPKGSNFDNDDAESNDSDDEPENISICIDRTEKKGGTFNQYFVYHIKGEDEKGSFSVARRFNEFFEMRTAIVARWPGCFVPSVPAKNMLKKNDEDLVERRKRYLNDFVNKMARLPHLYYGEEFQALLRLQEADISAVFSKWAVPSTESIINKYRVNFSELAGKELNGDTHHQINDFIEFIKRNQAQLERDRQTMTKLGQASERLKGSYKQLFSTVLPNYENICFREYCNCSQQKLLYSNQSEGSLKEHSKIAEKCSHENKYWLLYDMVRHEERDGLAFLEAFEAKLKYEVKIKNANSSIASNEKSIGDLQSGKKSLTTMTNKGTNEEIKYKLQVENQQLKREKENLLIMTDIISALIAYIEIERYKRHKRHFYRKALATIGKSQSMATEGLKQIWRELQEATFKRLK